MRINTNVTAMQANFSLSKSNMKTQKSNQRLSSGQRINKAADDSAGMAVANKIRTQVRGLKVAIRNSLDGVSLIQTAEGALEEVEEIMQRIRELSIQASNDTLDSNDRQAIQKEVDQLLEELNATTNLTEFNKIKLLNGDVDRNTFTDFSRVATCINVSDTVNPGAYKFQVINSGTTASLKGEQIQLSNDANGLSGRFCINDEEIKILETDTADDIFAKIRDLGQRVGVTVTYTGNSISFSSAESLNFETIECGSNQEIKIYSDNADLLNALGLTNTTEPIKGTDAVVNLIVGGSEPVSAITTGIEIPSLVDIKGYITVNGKRISIDIKASDSCEETLEKLNNAFKEANAGIVALANDEGNLVIESVSKGSYIELVLEGDVESIALTNAFNLDSVEVETRMEAVDAKPAVLELNLPATENVDIKGSFRLSTNGDNTAETTADVFLNISAGDNVIDKVNEALNSSGFTNIVASVSENGKILLTTIDAGANEMLEVKPTASIYDLIRPKENLDSYTYTLGDLPNSYPWNSYGNLSSAHSIGLTVEVAGFDTKQITLNFSSGSDKSTVVNEINRSLELAYGSGASPLTAQINPGTGLVEIGVNTSVTNTTNFNIKGTEITNDMTDVGLRPPNSYSMPFTSYRRWNGGNVTNSELTFKIDGSTTNVNFSISANDTIDTVVSKLQTAINNVFPTGTFSVSIKSDTNTIMITNSKGDEFELMGSGAEVLGFTSGADKSHLMNFTKWYESKEWSGSTLTNQKLTLDMNDVTKTISFDVATGDSIQTVLNTINNALTTAYGSDNPFKAEINGLNIIIKNDNSESFVLSGDLLNLSIKSAEYSYVIDSNMFTNTSSSGLWRTTTSTKINVDLGGGNTKEVTFNIQQGSTKSQVVSAINAALNEAGLVGYPNYISAYLSSNDVIIYSQTSSGFSFVEVAETTVTNDIDDIKLEKVEPNTDITLSGITFASGVTRSSFYGPIEINGIDVRLTLAAGSTAAQVVNGINDAIAKAGLSDIKAVHNAAANTIILTSVSNSQITVEKPFDDLETLTSVYNLLNPKDPPVGPTYTFEDSLDESPWDSNGRWEKSQTIWLIATVNNVETEFAFNITAGATQSSVLSTINNALSLAYASSPPIQARINTDTGILEIGINANNTTETDFTIEAKEIKAEMTELELISQNLYTIPSSKWTSHTRWIGDDWNGQLKFEVDGVETSVDFNISKNDELSTVVNTLKTAMSNAGLNSFNVYYQNGTIIINSTSGSEFKITGDNIDALGFTKGNSTSHIMNPGRWYSSPEWDQASLANQQLTFDLGDEGSVTIEFDINKGDTISKVADTINAKLNEQFQSNPGGSPFKAVVSNNTISIEQLSSEPFILTGDFYNLGISSSFKLDIDGWTSTSSTGRWNSSTSTILEFDINGTKKEVVINIPEGTTKANVVTIINQQLSNAGISSQFTASRIYGNTGNRYEYYVAITGNSNLSFTVTNIEKLPDTLIDENEVDKMLADKVEPRTDVTLSGIVFNGYGETTKEFVGSVSVNDTNVQLDLAEGLTVGEVIAGINESLSDAGLSGYEAIFNSFSNTVKLVPVSGSSLPTAVLEDLSQDLGLSGHSAGSPYKDIVHASVLLDVAGFLRSPQVITGNIVINLGDDSIPPNITSHLIEVSLDRSDYTAEKVADKINKALMEANINHEVAATVVDTGKISLTAVNSYSISLEKIDAYETLNALGLTAQVYRGSGGISDFSETATVKCEGNRVIITDLNNQKMIIDLSENTNKEVVTLNVMKEGPLKLQIGPNENMHLEIQIPGISSAALGIQKLSLRTVKAAAKAISLCDEAIAFISELRSKLGAYQNRLEHSIKNLSNAEINNTGSLSRIEDADMALEMSNYIQQNVISQSIIAVLVNENQLRQQLLKKLY